MLDQGTPRFYIMRLPARKPALTFDRITYHAKARAADSRAGLMRPLLTLICSRAHLWHHDVLSAAPRSQPAPRAADEPRSHTPRPSLPPTFAAAVHPVPGRAAGPPLVHGRRAPGRRAW